MLKLRMSLLTVVSLIFLLTSTVPSLAQKNEKKEKKVYTGTPVMWRAPDDIESRNLLLGAGGENMKPDLTRVTFVAVKEGGWSTKYRVRDASGNEWIAKVGKEAQPDTAANRLIWAIGYEPEIAYLVPKVKIEGKGEFENVRFEARPKDVKRTGNWLWATNPFIGKPEFQGLKIMMAFFNNWDLKDDNNEILVTKGVTDSERRFIISDLGGTFGKTGGMFGRSRNKPSDYVKAEFVRGVRGKVIDFNYNGKNQTLLDGITVDDAKWLASWLGRLSDEQIKDAFRAANYSPEDVDLLAGAVHARIDALTKISTNAAVN
jgi:hypothetical protein